MKICLKTHAKYVGSQTVAIHVGDRKPERVASLSELTCTFQVTACTDYYLLNLEVSGVLEIICQRCLAGFQQEYRNESQLAICSRDDVAERLMSNYECIVVDYDQVNLVDLIADELHLFLPEKHADFSQCDKEISEMIGNIR